MAKHGGSQARQSDFEQGSAVKVFSDFNCTHLWVLSFIGKIHGL